MKRVEIIVNSALEEDILEIFEHMDEEIYYSKINSVHGLGSSGPRCGDHIWPEENTIFIIYCEENIAESIQRYIRPLKRKFENEGIKVFII